MCVLVGKRAWLCKKPRPGLAGRADRAAAELQICLPCHGLSTKINASHPDPMSTHAAGMQACLLPRDKPNTACNLFQKLTVFLSPPFTSYSPPA